MAAGPDSDSAYEPLRTDSDWIVTISTEITHTFTSDGSVTMTCVAFSDKWIFEEQTRIIAVRVGSLHQSSAPAS